MYSEIKSSEQILINRLDENERIILEDIYKKAQQEGTQISFEKLTDESGDFGGVLVDIKTDSTEPQIELTNKLPEVEAVSIGDTISLPVEADVKDNTLVVYASSDDYNSANVSVTDNTININCTNITSNPVRVYYSVSAKGYKTLNGTIDINIKEKETQPTEFRVFTTNNENITESCNIDVFDENDTQYVLTYNSDILSYCTNLPKGNYTVDASYKEGGHIDTVHITINDETMLNPESTQVDITALNNV